MIGTLLNALTVLVGGTLGTFLGHRFPQRMHETIFAALGLFTLFIGMDSALATGNPLIVLGSLLLGALLGEAVDLDARLTAFGVWLQKRLGARAAGEEGEEGKGRFVQAFVTASIVFCVGPLTIQGAIEDGLMGDYTKLAIKSMLDKRAESQPLGVPSCGSVFRNPEGAFAGNLIEQAGLKGLRIGGAMVSDKHANFIINTGAATADDIERLIETVRQQVKERSGIDLELEARMIGERSRGQQ